MKNYAFLFWSYNIVWLGIASYLLFVFLRMKRLDRRLEGLEREVADRTSSRGREPVTPRDRPSQRS